MVVTAATVEVPLREALAATAATAAPPVPGATAAIVEMVTQPERVVMAQPPATGA